MGERERLKARSSQLPFLEKQTHFHSLSRVVGRLPKKENFLNSFVATSYVRQTGTQVLTFHDPTWNLGQWSDARKFRNPERNRFFFNVWFTTAPVYLSFFSEDSSYAYTHVFFLQKRSDHFYFLWGIWTWFDDESVRDVGRPINGYFSTWEIFNNPVC